MEWLAKREVTESAPYEASGYDALKTLDLNQPKQDPKTEHHALFDAMHDEKLFDYYMRYI